MNKLLLLLLLPLNLYAQTAKVRVTYYNLNGNTAIGTKVHNGICAVSRDLEQKGFKLGEKVYVEGYGTFQIQDRTAKRIKNTINIWLPKERKIKNGKNVFIKLIYNNE